MSEADSKTRARWKVLWSTIIAVLAVVMDGALLSLIAPAVAEDLNADAATMGLISSISVLMLAAFILGGGIMGDIYGRKRFLSYGLVGLTVTSILAIVVPSASLLVPVRAIAGIMAALVSPLALAIIRITFNKEELPKALGLYSAALGIAGGFGTIIVSSMNQLFGWRATFGLIVALALISFLLVRRFVQESKAINGKRVDWIGILLMAAGLFGVVYGINQAGGGFTSPSVLVPLGMGVVVLVILVLYSKRAKNPALQLSLFRDSVFSVGMLLALLITYAGMGMFFLLSVYLQSLQGLSPIQTSLTLLPYTLALFVFAVLAGGWVRRFSKRILVTSGLVLMVLGLVAIGLWLSPTAGFWIYLLPLILIGGGYSIANVPRLNVVLSSAPPESAGNVSATNLAFSQVGNSLGIAMIAAIGAGAQVLWIGAAVVGVGAVLAWFTLRLAT